MKSIERDLCKNISVRIPFFNVKPEYIKRLLNGGTVLERIATAICIPYLEKREQYRNHIPNCEKCKPVYKEFLKKMSKELGLSKVEIDKDYLEIYDRL